MTPARTTRRPSGARTRLRRAGGLSLVEMLVAVAAAAVLAGIAVPAYHRIQAGARSVQCLGNLRQIGIALNSRFQERGLVFPELAPARESRAEDVPVMDNVLIAYLDDEDVFRCPGDHAGHFERTGSSYFWNSLVNGQRFGNMDLFGLVRQEAGIPVASDKEKFHPHSGDGVNILYADGHVDRGLRFTAQPR